MRIHPKYRRSISAFFVAAAVAASVPPMATAESFFSTDNPFLLLDDPIVVGGDRFAARIDAVRTRREPIGLVLSGGSARAFAHVGVLEALEERGIRPDFVVANSMGAVVAILYAAGIAPADIRALIESYPVGELFEAAAPTRGGLLDARRFAAMIRELVAFDDIADFPIPLMVICEDIQSRRQVRLSAGEVGTVTTASFALPVIFDPVVVDGMRLIDGGVTNLVPVDAAAQHSRRVVAATSLYARELNLANPLVILNRSIDLGKTRNAVSEMDALRPAVIRCDVEDISYMDFDGVSQIVERGYRSAVSAMPEVLAVAGGAPAEDDAVLERTRAIHAQRVRRLLEERQRGVSYPLSPGAVSWTPVLRLFDRARGFGDASRGRRQAGLRTTWSSGLAELDLAAFGRWDGGKAAGAEGSFAAGDAGLSLGAAWRPGGVGEVAARGTLDVDAATGSFRSVLWEGSAGARFAAPGGLILVPALRGEALVYLGDENGVDLPPPYAEAGLLLGSPPPRPGVRSAPAFALEAAAFIDEDGDAGPGWEATAEMPVVGPIGLRLRSAGRLSAVGDGSSYRAGDGYRGPGGAESGFGSDSPAFGSATFRSVANAGIDLELPFLETDLAESLLLRRVSAGAFADALYAASEGTDARRIALGIAAELSVSVFGLSPVDVSLFASRDLEDGDWTWGIAGGYLFR